MTGHSTPSAIKMLAYSNYSTFSLVQYMKKRPSGCNCPGLSIITANGWNLSLGKQNKMQNLQVSTASPGTKCYKITYVVFMSLTNEPSALEHTVTVVSCPFARNGITEENQLLGNVGEIRCNRRSDIWQSGVNDCNKASGKSRWGGPRCRSWLRHCATNRQVAGSIPDCVSGFVPLGLSRPVMGLL
jgi:hypothetical protein